MGVRRAGDAQIVFPFPVVPHGDHFLVGISQAGGAVEQVIPPVGQAIAVAVNPTGMGGQKSFGVIGESFPIVDIGPAYFQHLTTATAVTGAKVAGAGPQIIADATAIHRAIMPLAGYPVQVVVEETEHLPFGILLAGQIAGGVVAVGPCAHIRIGHTRFATKDIVAHGCTPLPSLRYRQVVYGCSPGRSHSESDC